MRRHAMLQETASLVSAVFYSSFESRLFECVSDRSLRSARIKYQYVFSLCMSNGHPHEVSVLI
jgi:hypothetical protein